MDGQVRQKHEQISPYLKKKLPLKVPEKGELIYVGSFSLKAKAIKIFSFSTSAIGLCLIPNALVQFAVEGHSLLAQIAVGSGLSCFIILQPILLHVLIKRYVTWIYYNEETNQFTASTYNFLGRSIDHVFTQNDVEYYTHGLLSSIKIRGKPLAIDAEGFFDKEMYIKMMRYDTEEWEIADKASELEADVEKKEREKNVWAKTMELRNWIHGLILKKII